MSKPKHVHTITRADVGKAFVRIEGKTYGWVDVLGNVMEMDIGKRVYLSDGILQVESHEQMEERVEKKKIAEERATMCQAIAVLEHWNQRLDGMNLVTDPLGEAISQLYKMLSNLPVK